MKSSTTDYHSQKVVDQFSKTPLVHAHVGRPALLKFIGSVRGLKVLDLGCGPGYLCNELRKRGAECVGADPSAVFISEAAGRYPSMTFLVRKGSKLSGLETAGFDRVVLSMVLINVAAKAEFNGIFREAARVLRTGGELYISTIHPLVIRNFEDSLRKVKLPKNGGYLQKRLRFVNNVLLNDGSRMDFRNAHWTLSEISKELERNSFVITAIVEPSPPQNKQWPLLKDAVKTPHYIFLRARYEGR